MDTFVTALVRHTQWSGGMSSTPGQLLVCSVVVSTIVIMLSPPDVTNDQAVAHDFLVMAREAKDAREQDMFCVETATWLMECAWQVTSCTPL